VKEEGGALLHCELERAEGTETGRGAASAIAMPKGGSDMWHRKETARGVWSDTRGCAAWQWRRWGTGVGSSQVWQRQAMVNGMAHE
jgi:hypothetical protein